MLIWPLQNKETNKKKPHAPQEQLNEILDRFQRERLLLNGKLYIYNQMGYPFKKKETWKLKGFHHIPLYFGDKRLNHEKQFSKTRQL